MIDYELFIGGQSRPAPGLPRIERRHPATQELVATFACASQENVADAVAAAKGAAQAWRQRTPAERSALLLAGAQALEARELELAACIEREVGKSGQGALAEIREGVALWRYAAGAAVTAARR